MTDRAASPRFTDTLRQATEPTWSQTVEHRFVRELFVTSAQCSLGTARGWCGSVLSGLALGLLSGCVTAWQPPAGYKTAAIDFENASARRISVHIRGVGAQCSEPQPLMPLLAPGESRGTAVPIDRDVIFMVGQDLAVTSQTVVGCIGSFKFRPEAGKFYHFRFEFSEGRCGYLPRQSASSSGPWRLTEAVSSLNKSAGSVVGGRLRKKIGQGQAGQAPVSVTVGTLDSVAASRLRRDERWLAIELIGSEEQSSIGGPV